MARFRDREDRDQRLSSPSLGSLAIRSIPDRIVPALADTQQVCLTDCTEPLATKKVSQIPGTKFHVSQDRLIMKLACH